MIDWLVRRVADACEIEIDEESVLLIYSELESEQPGYFVNVVGQIEVGDRRSGE
jgi:hypothetical protein